MNGGREAEFGGVRHAKGVGGVVGLHDGKDGAKNLFGGEGVAFLDVGEDGGFDEVALVVSAAGETVAAAEGFAVFLAGDGDVLEVGFELTFVDGGADVDAGFHAVADFQLFGAFDEGGDEFVVDGGFDDGAAGGRALLAGGEEGRIDDVFDGGIEVAVGEDGTLPGGPAGFEAPPGRLPTQVQA